jgi:hypothetical protein
MDLTRRKYVVEEVISRPSNVALRPFQRPKASDGVVENFDRRRAGPHGARTFAPVL